MARPGSGFTLYLRRHWQVATGLALAALLLPVALFPGGPLMLLLALTEPEPMRVGGETDLPSPDGHWVATLETVDNGLGFGQGMLYHEVHVHRPGQPTAGHGNDAGTTVFYIEALDRQTGAPTAAPRLTWRDSTHLSIDDGARDERGTPQRRWPRIARHGDVEIAYPPAPQAPPP